MANFLLDLTLKAKSVELVYQQPIYVYGAGNLIHSSTYIVICVGPAMTERRQQEQPLTGSSMTANSSTNSSGLKKSASFTKSREPVQEKFKLSLQPKRKSDTSIITDTNKSLLITSKPINPRASVTNTSDEPIRTAIRKKLEQHTKSELTSLEEINAIVSSIYDIVGKEVDLALEKAKLRQSGSGAVITGLKVAEHPMSVTVKPILEETTEVNLAVVPTTSPTPPSTAGERPESTDSVETNKSPPQSASTQHSVRSEDSGKDIQYSTSSATNRSNENAPVKVAKCQMYSYAYISHHANTPHNWGEP